MTSVVAALDSYQEDYVTGENGRVQYNWSKDIKDKIVQLNFQIVRKNSSVGDEFENIYKSILNENSYFHYNERNKLITLMHKLVAFTRDVKGKGEYMIGYDFLYRLSKFNMYIAIKLIEYFVHDISYDNKTEQGYGSWKDLKYMWVNFPWNDTMKAHMIRIINVQLRCDANVVTNMIKGVKTRGERVSLLAKWIPRENSKYKALFFPLAENYYDDYLRNANSSFALTRAKKKAYMNYRKLSACINKYLDTTQIKQCSDMYDKINYEKVTSITMMKQTKAFLNIDLKTRNIRYHKKSRIQGAENLRNHFIHMNNNNKSINGKRVCIVDFVKAALDTRIRFNKDEIDIINSQWENFMNTIGDIGNFIAMTDTSASMRGDPFLASIGIGIAIAEKSVLGKRVLTFQTQSEWVNLEECTNFYEMIKKTSSCPWGGGTNFTSALTLICKSCSEKNLTNEQVSNLVLVVLSDMQIDCCQNEELNEPMWDNIKSIYASYGYKDIPTILFWNLRHTDGFPVKSNQKGAIMFSGYSPSLLNTFCEKGMDTISNSDPWNILQDQLNSPRYSIIDSVPDQVLSASWE